MNDISIANISFDSGQNCGKTSFKIVSNSGVVIPRRVPSFWSDFKAAQTIKWAPIVQLGKIVSLIIIASLFKFKYFHLESNLRASLFIYHTAQDGY